MVFTKCSGELHWLKFFKFLPWQVLQAALRAGEGEAMAARLDFRQTATRNGGNREAFGVGFSFVLKKKSSVEKRVKKLNEFGTVHVETMPFNSDF